MLLEPFDNAGSYVHSDDPRFRISFEIDRLVASQMIYLQKLRRHNRFGWTEGDFLSDENRGVTELLQIVRDEPIPPLLEFYH